MADIGPGTLVECIKDSYNSRAWRFFPNRAAAGKIYRVRDVLVQGEEQTVALLLKDVRNPPHHWIDGEYEAGFPINRFRPVDDRSEFTEWLEALPTELVDA